MTLLPTAPDALTDELCTTDPLAQQLRGLLYRLDREHEANGWGVEGSDDPPATSQPTIYVLEVDRERRHLSHRMSEFHTAALHYLAGETGGNLSHALRAMAVGTETTREVVTMLGVPVVEDGFGSKLGDNWRFYGLVFTSEAWGCAAAAGTPEHAALSAADARPSRMPGRFELRSFAAFTRDGHVWTYERARGDTESCVLARRAGQPSTIGGGVPHSLARMVNAIVAQQDRRPVPDYGYDEQGEVAWLAPNTAASS